MSPPFLLAPAELGPKGIFLWCNIGPKALELLELHQLRAAPDAVEELRVICSFLEETIGEPSGH